MLEVAKGNRRPSCCSPRSQFRFAWPIPSRRHSSQRSRELETNIPSPAAACIAFAVRHERSTAAVLPFCEHALPETKQREAEAPLCFFKLSFFYIPPLLSSVGYLIPSASLSLRESRIEKIRCEHYTARTLARRETLQRLTHAMHCTFTQQKKGDWKAFFAVSQTRAILRQLVRQQNIILGPENEQVWC